MTYPYQLGWRCNNCGSWVPNGQLHSCAVPWGFRTPPPPAPLTLGPGLSEERVREIVREELTRANPTTPTPEEAERSHDEIRRANEGTA